MQFSMFELMFFGPVGSALVLAFILGFFRIGDANADARRKPPLSASIALGLASLWLLLLRGLGVPIFQSRENLGVWIALAILACLAVHHSLPKNRGGRRSFRFDPSSLPASISIVLACLCTLEILTALAEHREVNRNLFGLMLLGIFSLAQFSLFIYRKWRPLPAAPRDSAR